MSNVQHAMPKINFASSMLVEDHLKKVLAKTTGKPWKLTNNKLLPKSQHSPFGDFPPEYMKKASNSVEPLPQIEASELSIAAKGHCKYIPPFERPCKSTLEKKSDNLFSHPKER